MQNLHCRYCHFEIMPVRDDVPQSFSVMCPNCHKRLTENDVYAKTILIQNLNMEKKNHDR